MSGGTRNYEAGSDEVYRVVMVYSDEYVDRLNKDYADRGWDITVKKHWYAAGPYTTPRPARQERNKLAKHEYRRAEDIEDVYVEKGTVSWERFE